ncbi:NitT/TauT family transport system permease protein [Clostridium sp. USBA 49]|uniref:ABC transporter permease n=1 Tax=Clostridium sp. USBA 49 TaxID=1881060 RepID=UPI00099A2D68|nr:ABC transporter permease [Clostridium sp. USBA 49]SKA83817.1 NitT/TauT family transport system permease protein [Clostridium sp. USBA 49]
MINESLEHKQYLKKVKRRNTIIIIVRLGILIAFFSIWEIAASFKWIDPFLTSSPSRMIKSLITVYNEGTLFRHIFITCIETVIGFLLSTIIGTLIAILLWWSDFANRVLDPYIVVLNALPKIALAPIIIFWMGNGMKAIVLVTVLISIVSTIISILNGFKEVDEDKIKLMITLGASKFQILSHLIIPASIPTLISSLKINVGLSWVGVIMGEFLVSKEGLGFLIVFGGQVAQLDTVMMSIIILSILAYFMYQIVAIIEKKFSRGYTLK